MALHTLGTSSTTILRCLAGWTPALPPADVAAVGDVIIPDNIITSVAPGATAVIGTGATHSNTTLDTLVRVSGAALAQIMVGDLVLGVGIPLGTYVSAKASTVSISLSASATTTAGGVNLVFVRPGPGTDAYIGLDSGMLTIPGRGQLKVFPGDVVAVDSFGWPILVSASAIAIAGSSWSYT